jgi:hypothetical protein
VTDQLYIHTTSFNLRLAIPEEELLYYMFLKVLAKNDAITESVLCASEVFMMRKGYLHVC